VYSKILFRCILVCFCKRLQEETTRQARVALRMREESTIPNAAAYTWMPLRGAHAPAAMARSSSVKNSESLERAG
jgi:hypothetical protein